MSNLILNTDSYKASHWLQYPPNTSRVYSYIESRGGRYNKTLFFGLQGFIKKYLTGQTICLADIEQAAKFWAAHGEPFNKQGWIDLLRKHQGKLPIEIKAVPEGTIVPVSNILVSVENTDPEFYWLTSYLETALLRAVWYPTTVATQSWHIKQKIKNFLHQTGDPQGLAFKLHDFGARGVSSEESASIGGAAHLVNFMGTDTVSGILWAMKYYNTEDMVGFSIPAAEHSTITAWGRNGEVDAYRNMLKQYAKPDSLVAVVSDSYDIFNAVEHLWGETLRQEVIDSGATVVVRPDSGDPATVVLKVAHLLDKTFRSSMNNKGYKVLNNVRIIQGDGITEDTIEEILTVLKKDGFSADNIAFGMGGKLLQGLDRDTQKFAMKASAAMIDGKWIDVYKDPVTDNVKKSKKGRLALVKTNHGFTTVPLDQASVSDMADQLVTVYKNGELTKEYTFAEVRENSLK